MATQSAPVEKKVSAATGGAVIGGFLVWVLDAYVFEPGQGGDVPEPIVALINLAVPAALAFIGGYMARHTVRPDIGQP